MGKGGKQAWAEEQSAHSVAPLELPCRGRRAGTCPLPVTESLPAPSCGLGLLSGMKRLISFGGIPHRVPGLKAV